MSADLVILNIGNLVTPYIVPPIKGEDMNKVKIYQMLLSLLRMD